jgi:hypothetical protein
MKVNATNRVGASSGAKGPQRTGGTFTLGPMGGAQETAPTAPAAGVTGVSSIDALLALQAVGDYSEKKRRAVGRASKILDVLDEVKVALIDGSVSPQALERLVTAVRDQRDGTDDPKLESVLDEIEIRAAVELAKLGHSHTGA